MNRPDIRRRRLLLWSALPALLALAVAVKLLGAAWSGGQAADAFARNDVPAAESAAAALGVANFFERHKAPFATGDALVLRGDYAGARAAFEAALADAPPADEYPVRVNLVLSIERLGDAAAGGGDGADGDALSGEALAVANDAPAGCFEPDGAGPDGAGAGGAEPGGAGERLQAAEQRLTDKLERLRDPAAPGTDSGADSTPETEPPAQEQQKQLEQLQESGKSAQQERNRGLQRDDYLNNSGPGLLTDKPW
ncbi:hypothetical protein [Arthrobacter sp. UYCu712]|uniref:hypothetical protein n=1 Tax=Arthrobacter sp. UYCu712 TaxID=3156340 RepID=UPI003395AF23